MDGTVIGSVVILGVLVAFGVGAFLYSIFSWYTSGESFIGRKFLASTVDSLQIAIIQGIAVAEAQSRVEIPVGMFLILLINCFFAGAGVVGFSSKVKKNSNAVYDDEAPLAPDSMKD